MQMLHMQIKERFRKIPFFIGEELWESLLDYLLEHFPNHSIFVISDSQVARLYAETARQRLLAHRFFKEVLTFPAGEQSKSYQQKMYLEDLLLHYQAGRDSLVIAMGGGVTGDLAGYVAATLHRGIPLIHLPTTLLAQVDSSIGGKVGINHTVGKNLIGSFYQPQAIFANVNFLKTLSKEDFLNGMAEVVKYAIILDESLGEFLVRESKKILQRDNETLKNIITRCVELKMKVVESDEKEKGYRSVLNFGHTAGHAVEKLSEYSIKHGFAIAAGMRVAARLSHQKLQYPSEKIERLNQLLQTYSLNRVDLQQFTIEQIWQCIITDKKARQQRPHFTLINNKSEPKLFQQIEKWELEHAFRNA